MLRSPDHLLHEIAKTASLQISAERAGCVQVLTSTKDIEMWGDGLQTRSFTFIDDCVEGILRITKSDFKEPLNLGSCEMVRTNLFRSTPGHSMPQIAGHSGECLCSWGMSAGEVSSAAAGIVKGCDVIGFQH